LQGPQRHWLQPRHPWLPIRKSVRPRRRLKSRLLRASPDQLPTVTLITASARACGASCDRLWPTLPVIGPTGDGKMPWIRAFEFGDPLAFRAAIWSADCELIPTAKGSFRAELTQIGMNSLWMHRIQVS